MKKVLLRAVLILCCGVAFGRPQFLHPTRVLQPEGMQFAHAAVDGDWIVASTLHRENIDPDDPIFTFDWWEKIVVFHRDSSGEWQIAQTLADEYAQYNSDERDPPTHGVAIANGTLAFSTNSGLRVFELVSGSWVPRTVTGAPARAPKQLAFDGTTLLASEESCATAATVLTRQAGGNWAALTRFAGQAECEEYFLRDFAVSGTRALVYEDAPLYNSDNDRVRLFERSGGNWNYGPALPAPPETDRFFGPAIALRGDVALVAGADGTHVYRRGAGGFTHTGTIPLLTYAFDWPYATDLSIGANFALQVYPGPWSWGDVAVLQPNASGGFDHVATLGAPIETGQGSLSISGRRVVTIGAALLVYDLPQNLAPVTPAIQDFENGADGWSALAGQFAVAQRGSTRVYRQSSLAGDAVAVQSADLTATTITADIRPTAFNGNDRWVGVMARYVDENNHYYLTLRSNNTISMRKKVGGVITELVSTQLPLTIGRNYRVTFEVVGDRLAYYLDGVLVTYRQDSALTHGRAGLRTYRASADFDNVLVTPGPVTSLARALFTGDIGLFEPVDGAWSWGGPFQLRQSSTTGDARILHGKPTDDQALGVAVTLDDVGTASGSHWVGAFVRYTDPANYYYLSLRSNHELSLRKLVNGTITVLGSVPFQVTPGAAHKVRIEAIGDKLIAYVDDQPLIEATDGSHPRGRYGVLTYRAAATYSDYNAWQP